MRRSLRGKIFISVLLILAVLLGVQALMFGHSFMNLYRKSILSSIQTELEKVTSSFVLNKAQYYYTPFDTYMSETGSPILVFDDTFNIVDNGMIRRMKTVSFDPGNGDQITVPLHYLYNVYGKNAPYLSAYRQFCADIVRVGSSSIYEPLTVYYEGTNFNNRSSMKKLEVDHMLSVNRPIDQISNLRSNDTLQSKRAEYLYDNVKKCLIERMEPAEYLSRLCSESFSFDDYDYRFFYCTKEINNTTYYFVTLQRIIITGFEQQYINRYMLTVYLVCAASIIILAFLLAGAISRPIKKITLATEKMAELDFDTELDYKGNDELRVLTDSINSMSSSLQSTMLELKSSNSRLAQAAENSKANEERMRQLLSELAHEFKTPLGIISGYTELIGMNGTEANAEYYEIIDDEIEKLTDMVNEAIDLAKLQSGKWKMNIGVHSIKDIVDDSMRHFENRLDVEGFVYTVSIEDCYVSCDALRIRQVISNFLSNALKYSDNNKKISVDIRILETECLVSVRNTGHIDQSGMHDIWMRDRVTDNTKTRLPSQGIGLGISRSILEKHGSRYGIENSLDGWVSFYFTLKIMPGI